MYILVLCYFTKKIDDCLHFSVLDHSHLFLCWQAPFCWIVFIASFGKRFWMDDGCHFIKPRFYRYDMETFARKRYHERSKQIIFPFHLKEIQRI